MNKEMIVSTNGHETMVAILEEDLVAEVFVERERQRGVVGNVYKGRVSKVLPGMQSSFIDIGLERDGFLYVAEVIDTLQEFEKLESDEDASGAGGRSSGVVRISRVRIAVRACSSRQQAQRSTCRASARCSISLSSSSSSSEIDLAARSHSVVLVQRPI